MMTPHRWRPSPMSILPLLKPLGPVTSVVQLAVGLRRARFEARSPVVPRAHARAAQHAARSAGAHRASNRQPPAGAGWRGERARAGLVAAGPAVR